MKFNIFRRRPSRQEEEEAEAIASSYIVLVGERVKPAATADDAHSRKMKESGHLHRGSDASKTRALMYDDLPKPMDFGSFGSLASVSTVELPASSHSDGEQH